MNRSSREPLFVLSGSIVFACVFGYPILSRLRQIGFFDDWDYTWQLDWAQFYSITHFHQLPLWNPYKCGGMQLLGNPQARMLTPFFLLHLLLGPVAGIHLEIVLHIAVAVSGAYFLARVLGLGKIAGVACGSVFAGSSWFFLHLAAGHAVFLPSSYLPWIVAFYCAAHKWHRTSLAGAAGAVLALMLFEGGVYSGTQAVVLVSTLAVVFALQDRSIRPLALVVLLCAFASGMAAVKLLPGYYMSLRFPRDVSYLTEKNSLHTLLIGLFSRVQDPSLRPYRAGIDYAFWEVGAYISLFSIPLIIVGCTRRPRDVVPWLVSGAVLLMLAMGNFAPYAPWSLFQHLPLFSSERVVTRYLIPFTLVAAVMSAFGSEFIAARPGPAWKIMLVYLAIMTGDLFLVSPPILWHMFDGSEDLVAPAPAFRQVTGDYVRFVMYSLSRANEGVASCYEYSEPGTPVRGFGTPQYRGEQYLLGPGSLRLTQWTPNALSYEVATPGSNVIVINQNYDAGWRLADGRGEIFSSDGLIGIRVPAGTQHMRLVYRSYAFLIGAVLSLLTFAAAIVLWVRERRQEGINRKREDRAEATTESSSGARAISAD